MKKLMGGGMLVLLLAAGAGVYFLLTNLDGIVEDAIETHGSSASRTAVRVGGVKIDLQDGKSSIRGLTVANPEGFEAPLAFSLDEVTVEVAIESLTEDVLVIERIIVRAPEVFFELTKDGRANLKELEQGLSVGSSKAGGAEAEGEGPEQRLIIRKFLFEGGKIHANVVPLGQRHELALPKIALSNLGGKKGAIPTVIARKLLRTLSRRAAAEVKKKGLDRAKEALKKEVGAQLEVGRKAATEEAGNQLKGLLGN